MLEKWNVVREAGSSSRVAQRSSWLAACPRAVAVEGEGAGLELIAQCRRGSFNQSPKSNRLLSLPLRCDGPSLVAPPTRMLVGCPSHRLSLPTTGIESHVAAPRQDWSGGLKQPVGLTIPAYIDSLARALCRSLIITSDCLIDLDLGVPHVISIA
jgi:hypothetical protein